MQDKGLAVKNGVFIGGGQRIKGAHYCDDQTGPSDNAPLTVNHHEQTGARITKFTGTTHFDNYLADICDNLSNFPHLSVTGVPSNLDAATQAAARTNPSRPYVDVPVALLELGDITRTLRSLGQGFYRKVAGLNMNYQFGIAPLVSDLVKLIHFQEQVDRRVKELDRLKSDRGLRRTVDIGTYSSTGTSVKTFQSVYYLINNTCYVDTSVTVRAHCRWKPSVNFESATSGQSMRALARRAVLGQTIDFSTAWELIPWSWLIDWGTNFGTFLKAHRNIIPATLHSVHVMKHTKTKWWSYQWGPTGDGLTMTPFGLTRDTKTREPSFVAPVAHFPFLDGRQVGILASLSVLRAR